jgi:hypothetical protein
MYPSDPTQPSPPTPTSPPQRVDNPLTVMQPGEQVICEIKRHPIGILGMYIAAGALIVVVVILAFIVAPNIITSASRSQVMGIGGLAVVIASLLALGFVFVANKVYWGNSWVLTTDSITQTTQTALFDKRSSQLSLGNLEDVTAEQNGIFPHMFNYGTLRVETAGERSKFMFIYCPNPTSYARQVLGARERFEQGRRGMNLQRPYRSEGAYQAGPSDESQLPPQAAPVYQPPAAPDPQSSYGYGTYAPPSPAGPVPDYPGNPVDPSAGAGVNVE